MKNKSTSCKGLGAVLIALTLSIASSYAQINPTSPTTNWTAVIYPAGGLVTPDPFSDQQTGSKEGDMSALLPLRLCSRSSSTTAPRL